MIENRLPVQVFLMILWATIFFTHATIGPVRTSQAAERVALVIGNGEYGGEATLRNPGKDADAMESALTGLGFSVAKRKNQDLTHMEDVLVSFRRSLGKGSLGLFFYAGHGMQVKNENFLVPVGAHMREEYEVKRQCLAVGQVLDAMGESESSLKVLILDCCRDNPFKRSWTRGSSEKGLASISQAPEGTLIAFSTSPEVGAEDGKGANSPYTERLVAMLRSRPAGGLELVEVFRETSVALKRDTGQEPWTHLGALDKYYLWRGMGSEATPSFLASSDRNAMSIPQSPTESRLSSREVTASFTIRLEENGPPAEGAQVELIYTAAANAAPLTLARATADRQGLATIVTALTVAQQQSGSFTAVASMSGMSKTWSLPDFPRDLQYAVWIPRLSAREVTASFTVHLDENGPPAEGAQVELVYTAAANAPPLTLARATADRQGLATIVTALTVAQQQSGSFAAVASMSGMSKEWSLPNFPRDLQYAVWIPRASPAPTQGGYYSEDDSSDE
jgi:hypothetical protein